MEFIFYILQRKFKYFAEVILYLFMCLEKPQAPREIQEVSVSSRAIVLRLFPDLMVAIPKL